MARKRLKLLEAHQLVNQDSGDVEYYSPREIVSRARTVLGDIDLDPSSSVIANQAVQAKTFFDLEKNGLLQPWFGKVWMNHPFSRSEKACKPRCTKKRCKKRGYCLNEDHPGNTEWIQKLTTEYDAGNIDEAICITFASTSEGWFKPLLAHPQCFVHGRVNYYLPNGKVKRGVTKGSVVTYLGNNPARFNAVFSDIGTVKKAY